MVSNVEHRVAIVRQYNSSFDGCPGEDIRIGSGEQPEVLNAHYVEIGPTTVETTQDVAVEILIAEEL